MTCANCGGESDISVCLLLSNQGTAKTPPEMLESSITLRGLYTLRHYTAGCGGTDKHSRRRSKPRMRALASSL